MLRKQELQSTGSEPESLGWMWGITSWSALIACEAWSRESENKSLTRSVGATWGVLPVVLSSLAFRLSVMDSHGRTLSSELTLLDLCASKSLAAFGRMGLMWVSLDARSWVWQFKREKTSKTDIRNTLEIQLVRFGDWLDLGCEKDKESKIVQFRKRERTWNVFRAGHTELKMPLGQLDKPVWSSEGSLWLEILSGSYQHRQGEEINALRTIGRELSEHVKGRMGWRQNPGIKPAFTQQGEKMTPVEDPEKESRVEGEPEESESWMQRSRPFQGGSDYWYQML